MKTTIPAFIATMLTIALAITTAQADQFSELYDVGSAGSLHEAAGAFVPVFDENGFRSQETVFLLNGGYPPELDAEPMDDVWILDGEFWHHMTTSAPAMAGHTLIAAADGRAYALGGVAAGDWLQPLSTITTFEVRRIHGGLDVVVETIQVPGVSPESCFGATAVAIDGGRSLLSVGGRCLGNPLATDPSQLWEYRIDLNRWSRRADLPLDTSDHSAVVARDFVWVFGGDGSQGLSNEIHRYDVLTDSWTQVGVTGDRPGARRDHGAIVARNTMLIFGGIEEPFFPETMDDVWQLDLDTLGWTEVTSLPGGLASMAIAVVPSRMRASPAVEALIYGGVTDAWSFPLDLSNSTLIYTSDVRVPMGYVEGPQTVSAIQ